MKQYKMLSTEKGSRDGLKVETFNKGETYDLNPELAEQFYHLGVITEVGGNPAQSREKKVTGPTETKDGEAGVSLDTQNIEELVALARDTYGLEVDSTMSVEDVKAAIEKAASEKTDEPDLSKMSKKDIVAFAKENLGLELDVDSKKDDLLAAIEAHTAA